MNESRVRFCALHVGFDQLLLLSPTQHQYHKIIHKREHCRNASLIKNCNRSFQAGNLGGYFLDDLSSMKIRIIWNTLFAC